MVKMYLCTKMKFLGQGFRKLEHEQDRQTDTQIDATECITIAAFAVIVSADQNIIGCVSTDSRAQHPNAVMTCCPCRLHLSMSTMRHAPAVA